MKRRAFMASVMAGLAGCGNDRGRVTTTVNDASRDNAENLERLLENDILNAEEKHLFVGNPNYYDFGLSKLTASDNPGTSVIADRLEAGEDPEKVWNQVVSGMGDKGEVIDTSMNDVLDYDILVEEDLDVLVLNGTSYRGVEEAARNTGSNMGELLGIDIGVEIKNTREFSVEEMKQVAENYPDSLVYHVFHGGDGDAGLSGPDHNLAMVNVDDALDSEDPVKGLTNIFRHEGFHATAALPHLPYDGENLMSVEAESVVDAELTGQAKDMVERYASSRLEYTGEVVDGEGRITAEFVPTYRIEDGEDYLVQNTVDVLSDLEFPYEDWSIEPREDTVKMRNNGVTVTLEPGKDSGYESVSVSY